MRLLPILLWACADEAPDPDVAPETVSDDAPAPVAPADVPRMPFLRSPYDGAFPASNPFDHAPPGSAPLPGAVLDFRGEVVLGTGGHRAWDVLTPIGTPLVAMAEGVVQHAGANPPFQCRLLGREVSEQLSLSIQYVAPDGAIYEISYDHLRDLTVAPGDVVQAGQVVAHSGNSGCSTGPHLHLGVHRVEGGRRYPVDPFGWQGERADPWAGTVGGAPSVWLWDQAPALWFERRRPADASQQPAPVVVQAVRFGAVGDGVGPHAERVELAVDPRMGADTHDVSGWTLAVGESSFTLPPGTTVSTRESLTVGIGGAVDGGLVWPADAALLPDGGGEVVLADASGRPVHALTWGLEATVPDGERAPAVPSCPDPAAGCLALPHPGPVGQPVWSPTGTALGLAVGDPAVPVVVSGLPDRPSPLVVDRHAGGKGAPEDVDRLRWLASGLLVFDAPRWDGGRTVWYAAPGFAAAEALPPDFGDEVLVGDARDELLVVSRGLAGASLLHAVRVGEKDPRPVTRNRIPEEHVVLSPDGATALFTRAGRLHRLDLATGEEAPLVNPRGGVEVAWLGDGPVLLEQGVLHRVVGRLREPLLEGVTQGPLGGAPDGSAVAVQRTDGTVVVLGREGQPLAELTLAGEDLADLALSSAGLEGWQLAWTARFAPGAPHGVGVVTVTR